MFLSKLCRSSGGGGNGFLFLWLNTGFQFLKLTSTLFIKAQLFLVHAHLIQVHAGDFLKDAIETHRFMISSKGAAAQ